MKTINEDEFQRLCEAVRADAPTLLEGVTDVSERTDILLCELFKRLCSYLHINCEEQMKELEDRNGFALLQTVEEHMAPEFFYSNILDTCLLTAV